MVAAFEGSGLTQAAFARQEGESEKAVSYWVRRVRSLRMAAMAPGTPPALIQVATVDDAGAVVGRPARPAPSPLDAAAGVVHRSSGVGIEVRCGRRSVVVGPGFDRALLRELLGCLEEWESPSC